MELTERKKKVLRSVVDLYIRTAEPVGSKAITELPDMNYSSATIRNEMADLTAMGYLEQPHTSAGRIPSPAGYRLYVDELMLDYRLTSSAVIAKPVRAVAIRIPCDALHRPIPEGSEGERIATSLRSSQ